MSDNVQIELLSDQSVQDGQKEWGVRKGSYRFTAWVEENHPREPSQQELSMGINDNVFEIPLICLAMLAEIEVIDQDYTLDISVPLDSVNLAEQGAAVALNLAWRPNDLRLNNWQSEKYLDHNGTPLWRGWREKSWRLRSQNEIAAIGHALLSDECQAGRVFSDAWFCGRLLYEFFKHDDLSASSAFLIGKLWGQFDGVSASAEKMQQARKLAGARSSADRVKRREDLLAQMEALVQRNPDLLSILNMDQLAKLAVDKARSANEPLWAQGAGQYSEYLGEIRRGEAGQDLHRRYSVLSGGA